MSFRTMDDCPTDREILLTDGVEVLLILLSECWLKPIAWMPMNGIAPVSGHPELFHAYKEGSGHGVVDFEGNWRQHP